ncbi:unnamed protein product [Dovyalis caffra]|uniref:Casein kinase substrate phosphoprotein PP28 domain-containing protein n=1 Tax=Dovyalis caffra TaxID=77055 RepID=A0AAV1QS50_9ROSI|nr:unnamed protein product [Dovyalis caffra]
MGRGKFKGKPTGHRHFSTLEELIAGTSAARPRTFKQAEAAEKVEEESEEELEEPSEKRKGTLGFIEIDNPNLVKPKNLKAKDVDTGKTTELSRREREEIEKQEAHERNMKLQEQGKTEQARKNLDGIYSTGLYQIIIVFEDLFSPVHGSTAGFLTQTIREYYERLALIRQRRAEAARKREEDKAVFLESKGEA